MVELLIMNEEFEILSVMDDFSSLAWGSKFFGVGDFQIECPIRYMGVLNRAQYIFRNDEEDTGVIEYINPQKDELGSWNIVIKGKFLKSLLYDRAINETMYFQNKTIEEIMLTMISHHFITNKTFKKFEVKYSNKFTERLSMQVTGVSVLEKILQLEEEQKVSCKVVYDYLRDKIVCSVVEGVDRTSNQNDNNWVVFSEDRENIYDVSYSKTKTFKNFAYVAGAGEGKDRIVTTVDIRKAGEPLKELYVDARDLQDMDDKGNKIPMEKYLPTLIQRGKEKLSEYTVIEELEAKANLDSVLKYKADYNLGDIVEFIDNEIGVNAALRIVAINEEIEDGKRELAIVFGKERLTLKDVIKREVM